MAQNGSIVVRVYPHSSQWSKWEKDSYVVDFLNSPSDLGGPAGDRRIRKHITLFLKVAYRSMALSRVRNDRFVENLARSDDKYERVYATRSEARKSWDDAQIALGAGLLGGLIASTIIPFAQNYGSEKRIRAAGVEASCREFLPYVSENACTLAQADYVADRWVGSLLSTGNLLLAAITITLVTVVIMKRILRQR